MAACPRRASAAERRFHQRWKTRAVWRAMPRATTGPVVLFLASLPLINARELSAAAFAFNLMPASAHAAQKADNSGARRGAGGYCTHRCRAPSGRSGASQAGIGRSSKARGSPQASPPTSDHLSTYLDTSCGWLWQSVGLFFALRLIPRRASTKKHSRHKKRYYD